MRRVVVFCLLALGLVACSSAPSEKPDTDPMSFVQHGAASATLPMAIPEGTVMLARMDLPELARAWGHLVELADETGAQGLAEVDPARIALAAVMNPDALSSGALDPRALSGEAFPGLDTDGTVYVAVSTAGNETLLRALELGAPLSRSQATLRGYFVRVRIPAADPDALAGWLRKRCEQSPRSCGDRVAVETTESAVRVDYRAGDRAPDAPMDSPDQDTAFVDAGSAALSGFLENPAALGLYIRSDRLADVGALVGMLEVIAVLESVSPEKRDYVYSKGLVLAGDVFQKLQPDAREVSDSTILLRAGGEAGFVIDTLSGLTERGLAVSKAGANSDAITRPMAGEALFEAQVAYDVSDSRAASRTPSWMQVGPERDGRDVLRSLRRGGVFTFGLAMHNYPIAYSRGLQSALLMAGDEEAVTAQQAEYLNGARAAVGLEPSDEGALGLKPVGGVTLTFDSRSDVDGWALMLESALTEEFDMPLTVTPKVFEDRKELLIRFGDDGTSGDASAVDGTARVRMDLAGLVDALRGVSEQTGPGVEAAMPAMEQLGVLTARARLIDTVFHTRLSLGDTANTALRLPQDPAPVAQTEPVDSCVRRAAELSREVFEALERATPQSRPRLMRKTVELLAETENECERRVEDVRWARGVWLQLVGTVQAQSLRWSEAAQSYEKACEVGVEYSCEIVERGLRVDLPTVTSGFLNWDVEFGQLLKLSPDSLSRWAYSPGGTDESQSAVSLDGVAPDSESVGGEITSLISEMRGRTAYVVADAQASAYVLARLNVVERLTRDRYRPIAIKGPPERRLGVVLAARHQDDDRPVRLDYRVPEPVAPLEWRMVVGEQTIDVIRVTDDGTEQVAPVDGCPKDGPTFCKDADLAEMAAMPFVDSTDDQIVDFVAIDVVVERPTRVGRLVEVTDRAWALLQERSVTFYFKLSPAE